MFAWGNNAMGQCGQGHTSTPVTKPKKVIGLEGVSIQQITAGTSHSLAWTAVPTDRWEERMFYRNASVDYFKCVFFGFNKLMETRAQLLPIDLKSWRPGLYSSRCTSHKTEIDMIEKAFVPKPEPFNLKWKWAFRKPTAIWFIHYANQVCSFHPDV